ncbi:MAG: hypothetical protein KatS3mg008_0025 [Acidimicrobiales bacterium]|nr:MAG: hypothetical protein KatS3mg008_0025 [Acidimicrobiales bacterium]
MLAQARDGIGDRGAMRILQVVTDDDRRGAQVFATLLGAELARRGHHVETVGLASGRADRSLGVRVLGDRRLAAATIRRLRRLSRGFEVVVAHGSSTLPASVAATFGLGVPVVYRQIADPVFWAARWDRRLRVAAYLRRVSRVVALSETTRRQVCELFWLDEQKVHVVPNGVPVPERLPARDEARARLGLGPEDRVVAYVGALVREKGVRLLVDAAAAVDCRLLVAGDGPERDAVVEHGRRTCGGRFRFVGPVGDPYEVYAAADVVALPSLGGDTHPAVLIEAGMAGVPVVATDQGAVSDIVVHGETGLLVRPGSVDDLRDALRSLLADPERAAAMGKAGRARCEGWFSIERVGGGWEHALRTAVV